MLLIVEGQRNTGKTTAIREFERITKFENSPLFKYQPTDLKYPRPVFPVAQIVRDFSQKAFDKSRVWITDRGHISEQVYTELTGRKVNWVQSEMSWAEYFLSYGNVLLVHFHLDVESLRVREAITGKPSEGDIETISHLFERAVKRSCLQKITINVAEKSPLEIAKIIEREVYNSILGYKDIP